MNLDYGRIKDLEILADGIKNARNVGERQYLEKIAFKVMNESVKVKSLRKELLGAFRVRDMAKVKRIQAHIAAVRLDETGGKSWGQLKGERKIYG